MSSTQEIPTRAATPEKTSATPTVYAPSSSFVSSKDRMRELAVVVVVFGACGCGALTLQAVALRVMGETDVGRLVLAWGVVSIGSTIVGLGVPQLVARIASADRKELAFRLPVLRLSTLAAVPLSLIVVTLSELLPEVRALGWLGFVLLAALTTTANGLFVESGFRRAGGHVVSGAFVAQAQLLLLSAALGGALILNLSVAPTVALFVLLLIQVGMLAVSLSFRPRARSAGTAFKPSRWVRSNARLSLGFGATSTLAMGFRWSDRIVLAGVLSLGSLGQYQSLVVLTSLFDLAGVGLGYVSLPYYARLGRQQKRSIVPVVLAALFSLVLTVAGAAVLGGPVMLIDWSRPELLTFGALTVVGICKLFYAEFSSVVGGIGDGGMFWRFAGWMACSLLVGIAASIAFGEAWGMVGAAAGAAIAWMLRVLIARRFAVKAAF